MILDVSPDLHTFPGERPEVVWVTNERNGLPHLAEFTAANPHIIQHQSIGKKLSGEERYEIWRNCDRSIRDWWRANRDLVKSRHVIFMEWDVVCNVPIDSLLMPADGLVCAEVTRPQNGIDSWYWFEKELPKLPPEMQATACGAVPLAVLQFSRNALDLICDARFDKLYALDRYCELRTPSILSHLGVPVQDCAALKTLDWRPQPYPWLRRGIFHPVKKSYYLGGLTCLLRRWFCPR